MKKIKLLVVLVITAVIILLGITISNAVTTNSNEDELKQFLENEYNVDTSSLDMEQLLKLYNELSEQYTNEQMANMIEDNKDEIINSGVPADAVSAGTQILKTTDTNQLREILNNDLDVTKIQEMLNKGYTPSQVLNEVMTPAQTASFAFKVLLANNIVKIILIALLVWITIEVIVRWVIFKKAGEHGWASIIPIYRDIVYLRICGISPWLLLFVFIPIIGWLVLWAVNIISKFELSKAFGKGILFGLGLWFFDAIFELILAASKKIKYIGFEE